MTLAQLKSMVVAAINAVATGSQLAAFPSASTNPRYSDDRIETACEMAARRKLGEYASNVNSPGRSGLEVQSSPLLPVSSLPARYGPITAVRVTHDPVGITLYQAAERLDSPTQVMRLERDGLSLRPQYYFTLDGETIYHTGTYALVRYVPLAALDPVDVTQVLAPDEIEVLCWALAIVQPFEGEQTDAAEYWRRFAASSHAQVMGVES